MFGKVHTILISIRRAKPVTEGTRDPSFRLYRHGSLQLWSYPIRGPARPAFGQLLWVSVLLGFCISVEPYLVIAYWRDSEIVPNCCISRISNPIDPLNRMPVGHYTLNPITTNLDSLTAGAGGSHRFIRILLLFSANPHRLYLVQCFMHCSQLYKRVLSGNSTGRYTVSHDALRLHLKNLRVSMSYH